MFSPVARNSPLFIAGTVVDGKISTMMSVYKEGLMNLYDRVNKIAEQTDWSDSFSVNVRDDGDLRKMLEYIRDTAKIGHSFDIVVDPGDREYQKRFHVDGDGQFRVEIK